MRNSRRRFFRWNKILAIPLFLGIILTWLLWPQKDTIAGWFDESWAYRTALTIGNTGSADGNKKVKFDIDTSTLITAGKIQSDCGDSRFTDISGKPLKYYIDSAGGACNTASTDYYVLIPVINSGSTTIFHYYGNSSAPNGTEAAQFTQSTFSPTSGPSTATEEQSPGPAVIWSFDEGSGTTTYDKNPAGVVGTLTSGPLWKTESECISGKCLYFDGSDDHVLVSAPSSIQTATRTVSFWMKQSGTVSETKGIVSLGGSNYYVGVTTNGAIIESHRNSSAVQKTGTSANGVISPNVWYHVAVVTETNGANVTVSYYLDGKYLESDTFADGHDTSYNSSLRIARITSSSANLFPGYVDEVRIYPYARSAAQIETDYNERGSTSGAGAQFGNDPKHTGESLANGLVGWWKMDETSTPSVDSSGNSGNGTWTGNATSINGKFGNAIDLDGAGDYVSVNDSTAISPTSQITVAGWIYRDTVGSADAILGKYVSGSNRRSYLLGMNTSVATFILSSTGSSATLVNGTTTIAAGAWYHVVGTYDGSTMKVYVNGVLEGSTAFSGGIYDSTDELRIGDGDQTFWYLDGKIDDVRLYNRSLSPAEIQSLYNYAPLPIGHWKLDDHIDTSATDSSGNGNNGTLTSGPTWTSGKFGSAVNFDGTNDYIDTSANNSLKGSSQFTISAWIKPSALDSLERDIYVEPRNADGSIRVQLAIASDNQLYFGVRAPDSGASIQLIDDSRTLSTTTWQHVAAVFDSVTDVHYLYLNGIRVSASVSVPALDSTAPNSNPRIGSQIGSNFFKGNIDDVRVYNYARTQEQVTEDMNAGRPNGNTDSPVGYYKFNEGYGISANDSTGNGNTGTLTNMTSPATSISGWTNSGKIGKGLLFDGTNDYITVSSSSYGLSSNLTISAWIYPLTDSDINYCIVGSAAYSTSTDWWLHRRRSGLSNQLSFQTVGGAQVSSSSSISANTWTHVTMVLNNGTATLYINGKVDGINTSFGTLNSSNAGIKIGERGDGVTFFSGTMDEVKVYPYALTPDQVLLDYNQGQSSVMGYKSTASDGVTPSNSSSREYCVPGDTSTCNPPVGEWKFDEKVGNTANDSSGNGYSATITNPAWTQGKFASALATNVNNTQEVATVSDPINGDLDFTGSDDLTLSIWIKSNNYSESPIFLQKLQDRSGTLPGYNILVSYAGGSNTFICELYDGTHSDSANYNSDNSLTDNKWHQVTCILDRNGSEMGTAGTYLFIDGKQAGFTSYTVTGSLANARNLTLGESTSADLLNGAIDNAVIYKYARTRAQIAWDFNHGAPIDHYRFDECSGTTAYDSASSYSEIPTGNNGTITIGASGPNTSAGTCSGSSTEAWKNGANGKINSSLDFDGTDDIVTITNTSSIDFNEGLTNGFTVSGWIYPNSDGENHVGQFVYKNNVFYCATTSQSGSNLNMQCYLNLSTSVASIIVTNALTINTWNHFAVSWTNDSDDEISVWINGKYRGSSTNGSGNPSNDTSSFYIGGDNFGLANYDGKVDDLKIFNYELTANQIMNVYNGGSAVQFTPITGSP